MYKHYIMSLTTHHLNIRQFIEAYNNVSENFNINIPTFQRGLVWSEKQNYDFIDSLYRNYPIQSLTLVRHDFNHKLYDMIDGLQRSNAIYTYYYDPFGTKYCRDMFDDLYRERISILWNSKYINTPIVNDKNREDIYDEILNLKKLRKMFKKFDYDSLVSLKFKSDLSYISKTLDDYVKVDYDKSFIISSLKTSLTEFISSSIQIDNYNDIICSLYIPKDTADKVRLLQRVNFGGTKLPKRFMTEALWDMKLISINDDDIEASIRINKLKTNKNLHITDVKDVSITEYLHGLSRFLFEHNCLLNYSYDEFNDMYHMITYNLIIRCLTNNDNSQVSFVQRIDGYNSRNDEMRKVIDEMTNEQLVEFKVKVKQAVRETINLLSNIMKFDIFVKLVHYPEQKDDDEKKSKKYETLEKMMERYIEIIAVIISLTYKDLPLSNNKKVFIFLNNMFNPKEHINYNQEFDQFQNMIVDNNKEKGTRGRRDELKNLDCLCHLLVIYAKYTMNDCANIESSIEHICPVAIYKHLSPEPELSLNHLGNTCIYDLTKNIKKSKKLIFDFEKDEDANKYLLINKTKITEMLPNGKFEDGRQFDTFVETRLNTILKLIKDTYEL
ncbi:Uncharacterised protein [uncultured archaeon]|nr:Uncharacterised protein [uncultured archaeon]